MSSYDEQYLVEKTLFGLPYSEFVAFVEAHGKPGGRALDLGCGQGRDALMLARFGYNVIGVDSSQVGISQMIERAGQQALALDGVVADLFEYEPDGMFDAVVLDSILHFGKADKARELALLDKLTHHIDHDGFLFIFVHRATAKERVLANWYKRFSDTFSIAEEGYIDYVYKESVSGFESAFQYYMLVLQRIASSVD